MMRFLAGLFCCACLMATAAQAENQQTFTAAIKAVCVQNGITEEIETKLLGNKKDGIRSTFASAKMKYACSIQPVVSDKIPDAVLQYVVEFKISDGDNVIGSPRMVVTADNVGEIEINVDEANSFSIQTEITE
jgi:hypothetical protein